jgi:hypothetical protein
MRKICETSIQSPVWSLACSDSVTVCHWCHFWFHCRHSFVFQCNWTSFTVANEISLPLLSPSDDTRPSPALYFPVLTWQRWRAVRRHCMTRRSVRNVCTLCKCLSLFSSKTYTKCWTRGNKSCHLCCVRVRCGDLVPGKDVKCLETE